ncbi:hypothetical protein GQ600_21923 [Phytophthora cactorum]|nr:hypothetical protein GQ600_21923 [Phytophthora cactorum]
MERAKEKMHDVKEKIKGTNPTPTKATTTSKRRCRKKRQYKEAVVVLIFNMNTLIYRQTLMTFDK